MNTINPKLQRMIDEFASAYLSHIGNPAVLKHNLEAAIKDSPELTLKLNRAAEQGYIQKFGILGYQRKSQCCSRLCFRRGKYAADYVDTS